MSSIIENLYYGNIPLSERSFRRTGEYAYVLQLAAQNEEKLTETLTEVQKKETFGKFKDNTSELTSIARLCRSSITLARTHIGALFLIWQGYGSAHFLL